MDGMLSGCKSIELYGSRMTCYARILTVNLPLIRSTKTCRLQFYAYLGWPLWSYSMRLYLRAYIA